MQPRSPAEVVSMGEPQVWQTRAFLLIAGIRIRSLSALARPQNSAAGREAQSAEASAHSKTQARIGARKWLPPCGLRRCCAVFDVLSVRYPFDIHHSDFIILSFMRSLPGGDSAALHLHRGHRQLCR